MVKGKYVFISYSRHDRGFVDQLANNLRQAGIQVWQDVQEIMPGTDWAAEIQSALIKASALLFISSKNSVNSHWMVQELLFSIKEKKKVIPIILDDVAPEQMHFALKAIQWIDFRSNYQAALSELIKSLSTDIHRGSPLKAKTTKSKGYAFLSYAEEDSGFIDNLKLFLRDRGYAYWDYNESDRDYHTSLVLELESIITEAVATLSILSPDWKKSKWTIREYFFSEEAGIPVFLLKAKEMGPTLAIAGEHFIDFVGNPESGFQKLDRELSRKGL